jgi:serine/threonine-protein kinase
MPKARAAATRAIELDPDLAEGYFSMGMVYAWYEFDWKRSAEHLTRAMTLNPNDAAARFWYGWILVMNGHFEEGIAQASLAHDRDPLSAFIETGVAQMHYYSGDVETAIKKLRAVVDAGPDFVPGHLYLGIVYLGADRYEDAIRELERALALDSMPPMTLAYLAYAHAKSQHGRVALELAARLTNLAKSRYVSPYLFAIVAAGLGRNHEVLHLLESAYEAKDDMVTILRVDPLLNGFRNDPRYLSLVDKVNFGALTPLVGASLG